jgi:hypothetical protein
MRDLQVVKQAGEHPPLPCPAGALLLTGQRFGTLVALTFPSCLTLYSAMIGGV